jgi:DNA-binding CsgD family transcriptional regulator/tetratricopeptide (TPR) repeat protein
MPAASLDGLLIGRDDELATLMGCVNAVATGSTGQAVLVEGEPGIGKSALMRAACAEAIGLGCQVFWGAGDELGQTFPLLPFLDGLRVRESIPDPQRETILALLRGELASEGEDLPAALMEQLLVLIDQLCAARPTVLVIDDLQWADHASVSLWERLARSAGHRPLLLAGMMRPVPQQESLLALRANADIAARVQLDALPEDAVVELVAAITGGQPAEDLQGLAAGAAGNPLYLTELVEALVRSDGVIITGTGAAELTRGCAPGSLSAAIADRFRFVPGPGREVLRAAALLGVDFTVPDLATLMGRGVGELLPALDEACVAGVLADSGTGLRFRHPLIRAALYDEIPVPVRAAWHWEAGRALARAGAPADRVARQLLPAIGESPDTEPIDEWTLRWLTRTAPLLVGQAPRVAADLLGYAVDRSPASSPQHESLLCCLAEALYRVGDAAEAERVASRALANVAEPDLRVDLQWTLAQCRTSRGGFTESLTALDQALASPGVLGRRRARLLVLTARAHRHLGQVEKAGSAAAAGLAEATDAADSWATAWALHMLTGVAMMQGRTADALPLFDRALTVTQADPALTDLRLLLQLNKALALGDLDQYDGAFAAARQAQQLAERAGIMVRLALAQCCLGQLLFDTGHWDEALDEVGVLKDASKDPGVACCDHGVAAVILFHRGEADLARRHLAAATPHAQRLGNRVVGSLALARSLDAELAGHPHKALAVLTGFADNAEEVDEIEGLLADGVRLAMEIGDRSAARALAARAAALASTSPIPHRQASALYCQGLLDHDGLRLLRAADRYFDACRPQLAAKALEAAAAAFLDTADRGAARAAYTRALDLYTSLGATWDAGRLQARFRAEGIRRGPRVKHRRTQQGWDSLTPAEVKVAGLVAHGLSNPQIAEKLYLSPRTVSTHVSHILSKLGVRSRIDIACEATRQGAL